MHRGWISIHRKILDNKMWKEKPFSKGQAWIDLLLQANHTTEEVLVGNQTVVVERGSFITSLVSLSDRWGWDRKKTRAFLNFLEAESMIVRKSDNKRTAVTIVNYCDYQDSRTANGTTKGQQKDSNSPAKGQQLPTNNNDNNVNNIINTINTNNIIDSFNSEKEDVKTDEPRSEACEAIKMMRAEHEERVKPKYSPWEEHQCSGTLKRLQDEYEDVFDPKWIKWNDYDDKSQVEKCMEVFNSDDIDDIDEEWVALG